MDINSRSQSCLSVRTMTGSVAASASSCALIGASRTTKSLRIPPVVTIRHYNHLYKRTMMPTMWSVGHGCSMGERLRESWIFKTLLLYELYAEDFWDELQ